MNKTLKKLTSIVAVMVCLFMIFSCAFAYAEDTVTKGNAVVLVLDISGSMRGEKIAKLKEATIKFAEELINGGIKNKIAIVTFESNCTTLPFTNDLIEIRRFINIKTASGGTDMTSGIQRADKLLSEDSVAECTKSIVIMSDGDPNNRSSATTAATELFDQYNIYSIGLMLSSSQKTFMESIQNRGYFDADNINELVEKFVEVVQEILPLFDIELNYNTEDVIIVILNSNEYYNGVIKITAKITNNGNTDAENAKAKINLPAGLSLLSVTQQDIGNIKGKSSATVTWEIGLENFPAVEKKYQYSIIAWADNAVEIEKFQTITLPTDTTINRQLSTSDTWSFSHGAVGSYDMTQEHLDYLLNQVPEDERKNLRNKIINTQNSSDGWGGSCFGMAKSAILFKIGALTPQKWSSSANKINDLTIDETRSLINYYFFTQETQYWKNIRYDYKKTKSTIEQRLTDLIELSLQVKKGGIPVFLGFGWNQCDDNDGVYDDYHGHVLVAYDVETADSNNNGIAWTFENDNNDYTTRVVTYDVNYCEAVSSTLSKIERSYVYITSDGQNWTIPNYANRGTDYQVNYVFADSTTIDCYNIEQLGYQEDSTLNEIAIIRASLKRKDLIAEFSNKKQTAIIQNGKINGDFDLWKIESDNEVSDKSSKNYEYEYGFINDSTQYTYSVQNGASDIDLFAIFKDSSFQITADKFTDVTYNPEESMTVNTEGGNTYVYMAMNDEINNLPWYLISAETDSAKTITLENTEKGVIVYSDNLKDIIIKGENDTEEKEITVNTDENSVLITEAEQELVAYVDKDNDGIYETDISSDSEPSQENVQLENLKVHNARLTPDFNSSVYNYTSTVDNSIKKISLTPTLNDGTTATISINSSKAVDFNSKYDINLNVGKNVIKIVVSDNNRNENAYTIIVIRDAITTTETQSTVINKDTAQNQSTDKSTDTAKVNDSIQNTGYNNIIHAVVIIILIASLTYIGYYLLNEKWRKKHIK